MTLTEYINTNLKGIMLRGFSKDGEYVIRISGIRKNRVEIIYNGFVPLPKLMRIDVPIEGLVISLVAQLVEQHSDIYIYQLLEKGGLFQRRSKERYTSFEKCQIGGFKAIMLDISESGCQLLAELKPTVLEFYNIEFSNFSVSGKIMWYVEEDELYRCGIFVPETNEDWNNLFDKYKKLGVVT